MAEKETPEEVQPKREGKKLFKALRKLPLDGILLVFVPFVAFLLLFLYVMGFIPPQPVTVHLSGESAGQNEEAELTQPAEIEEESSQELAAGREATTETVTEAPEVVVSPVDTTAVEQDIGQETAASAEPGIVLSDSLAAEERIKKIKQLAKVYEQMNASSVAAIVKTMGDDEAVDILSNMKPRSAAKVLASLDPARAATLSLLLTR
jgi:flagellar motility protein MotE (MotC chaperone)